MEYLKNDRTGNTLFAPSLWTINVENANKDWLQWRPTHLFCSNRERPHTYREHLTRNIVLCRCRKKNLGQKAISYCFCNKSYSNAKSNTNPNERVFCIFSSVSFLLNRPFVFDLFPFMLILSTFNRKSVRMQTNKHCRWCPKNWPQCIQSTE